MPEPGKYLLGGNEALLRNIKDYRSALHKVSLLKYDNDMDWGRLLAGALMRQEFSKEELGTGNITGGSRDSTNKRHLKIPKLNPVIMEAIFTQAQHQFPGFTDEYVLKRCNKTVLYLNDICKRARQDVMKEDLGIQAPAIM